MDPDPTADPSVQCYRLLKKVKIFLLFLLLCSFTILLNTKKMFNKKITKNLKHCNFFWFILKVVSWYRYLTILVRFKNVLS